MKNWFYGWELLDLLKWTPHELLSHFRAGLRCYDDEDERIYTFDLGKRLSFDDIFKPPSETEIKILEETLKISRFKYLEIIAYLNDKCSIDFISLVNNSTTSKTKVDAEPAPEQLTQEQGQTFIKSLSMAYISDTEISIKSGDKRARKRDKEKLGFCKAGKAKIWNAFIKVFKSENYYFNLNETDAMSKDSARQYLKEINNKLITFLNKEYKVKFPDGFKLYEKVESEGPGIYQFKFAIDEYIYADIEEFKKLSDEDLLSQIKILSIKFKKANNSGGEDANQRTNTIQDKLLTAVTIAKDRKLLDESAIKRLIYTNQDK